MGRWKDKKRRDSTHRRRNSWILCLSDNLDRQKGAEPSGREEAAQHVLGESRRVRTGQRADRLQTQVNKHLRIRSYGSPKSSSVCAIEESAGAAANQSAKMQQCEVSKGRVCNHSESWESHVRDGNAQDIIALSSSTAGSFSGGKTEQNFSLHIQMLAFPVVLHWARITGSLL